MKKKKILGRIPLPKQKGGPQTTKKGKRGYNRKRDKKHWQNKLRQTNNDGAFIIAVYKLILIT